MAAATVPSVESGVSVPSLAVMPPYRYTGDMPRNEDEITATAAIQELGTYRKYFYELVASGRVKQHFRRSERKRPFYLKSEIRALKVELDAEGQSGRQ